MVTFKLGSKKYQFPTRWDDVTYSQYVAFLNCDTLTKTIAVITGIDHAILLKAEIKGLEDINAALQFLNKPPEFKPTYMLGDVKMPKNITVESLGQFEDLVYLMKQIPTNQPYGAADIKVYAQLCMKASMIYYIKAKFGEYDSDLFDGMQEVMQGYPCTEVIGVGSFFLARPLTSSKPTAKGFLSIFRRQKKS